MIVQYEEGPENSEQDRELLRRAYHAGFFETPRQVSLVELGREFGHDRQEVRLALQRALRRQLAQEFE